MNQPTKKPRARKTKEEPNAFDPFRRELNLLELHTIRWTEAIPKPETDATASTRLDYVRRVFLRESMLRGHITATQGVSFECALCGNHASVDGSDTRSIVRGNLAQGECGK